MEHAKYVEGILSSFVSAYSAVKTNLYRPRVFTIRSISTLG